MHSEEKQDRVKQERRQKRVRRKLLRLERPRLCVFRSAKHIYAQIIDDRQNITLVGFGSYDKELRRTKGAKEIAKKVGVQLAKKAKEKNIQEVVFDRGRYKFHGRIAALAEGAREAGLSF